MSLINDIKYFHDINLMTDEDTAILKREFLDIIDELEYLAETGKHKNGNAIDIYISNINFEASYSYLESPTYKTSLMRLYSINYLSSSDPLVFNRQKEWIQTLRKYSTLITVSGEAERLRFLDKQREDINNML
jgi:hypothetical protein